MSRIILFCIVLLLPWGVAAAGVADARREAARINALTLVQWRFVEHNDAAMAPSTVDVWCDAAGRCRKVRASVVGADGAGVWIGYYDVAGKLVLAVWSEGILDSYFFRGVLLCSGGRVVQLASRIDDRWMATPPLKARNASPALVGVTEGKGYYVKLHPTLTTLFLEVGYPAKFTRRGVRRFPPAAKLSSVYVNGDGVRVRAAPSLGGRVLGELEAGMTVMVQEYGRRETVEGLTFPWVKVYSFDNGKKLEGWVFGLYLEPQ